MPSKIYKCRKQTASLLHPFFLFPTFLQPQQRTLNRLTHYTTTSNLCNQASTYGFHWNCSQTACPSSSPLSTSQSTLTCWKVMLNLGITFAAICLLSSYLAGWTMICILVLLNLCGKEAPSLNCSCYETSLSVIYFFDLSKYDEIALSFHSFTLVGVTTCNSVRW